MKPFKWKDVDLNLLVALQALYQKQSVSQAAEQCYVSQSAMSHTLQRLRTLFDDPLFRRVGIRMEPTQRAHDIAPIVDGLLQSIRDDLLTSSTFSVDAYQGVWKIGLTDYAEQLFAPALFDPQVLPFKHSISLEEFAAVEHALVSPDGNLQTQVDSELAKLGHQRRVSVASRNFLTIRRLLLGRRLLCTVPKRFAKTQMYSHSLMALPAPIPIAGFDISCLCLKAQQHEAKNRWLRELVREIVVAE